VICLGFVIVWCFGYFVGKGRQQHPLEGNHGRIDTAHAQSDSRSVSPNPLANLVQAPGEFRRQSNLTSYAATLRAEDMPGAVNEALQLTLEHRNAALAVLFGRWSELDPAAAAKYASLLPKSSDLNGVRQSTLAAWGEQDFEAALAWARNRESDDARKESLSTVLAGLAAHDPVKALRLISDTFSFADSGQTYDRVFKVWAEHDIAAAVAAAKALKNPELRERALRVVLDRQLQTDPRGALDSMREANLSKDTTNLVFNAFERWVERDRDAARGYLPGLPPGDIRSKSIFALATAIGRDHPQDALDWSNTLTDPNERAQALARIFNVWPATDAQAALVAARGLPDASQRSTILAQLSSKLVENDLPTALGIITELPAGQDRNTATAAGSVARAWAANDPDAAAKWAMQLSDPEAQANALRSVGNSWTRKDPTSAAHWLESLPSGAGRDGAVEVFGYGVVGKDPEGAVAWASTISDPVKRDGAVRNLMMFWMMTDKTGSEKWLQKTEFFSPEMKANLQFLGESMRNPGSGMSMRIFIDPQ
jgi:hypothetical protein